LADLSAAKIIQTNGVEFTASGNKEKFITFQDWSSKIRKNFEKCFWIPVKKEDDKHFDIKTKLVNRRGIYKDVYKSEDGFTDY